MVAQVRAPRAADVVVSLEDVDLLDADLAEALQTLQAAPTAADDSDAQVRRRAAVAQRPAPYPAAHDRGQQQRGQRQKDGVEHQARQRHEQPAGGRPPGPAFDRRPQLGERRDLRRRVERGDRRRRPDRRCGRPLRRRGGRHTLRRGIDRRASRPLASGRHVRSPSSRASETTSSTPRESA